MACGLSRAALPCAQSSNDIYAPCGGTVIAVNEALEDEPELLNASAHGDGWIAEFEARPNLSVPFHPPLLTAQLRAHRICLLTPVAGLRAQLEDMSEMDDLMDAEAYAAHVRAAPPLFSSVFRCSLKRCAGGGLSSAWCCVVCW